MCLHCCMDSSYTHTQTQALSLSHMHIQIYIVLHSLNNAKHDTLLKCNLLRVICLFKKIHSSSTVVKNPKSAAAVKYCSPVLAWGRHPNRGKKMIRLGRSIMSFSFFEQKAPFCLVLPALRRTSRRKLLEMTCLAILRSRTSPPEETAVTCSHALPPALEEKSKCMAVLLLPVFPENWRAAAPQSYVGSLPPCARCSDSNGTSLAEEVDYIP